MPYRRPIKTIASVGGLYSKSHNETQNDTLIIVSDTEPTTREDGTSLETGDHWFNSLEENTYIYIETEWKRVLSTLDTSGLELTNATVTRLNSIDNTSTLPPASGLSSQEDANLWFLEAITLQDEKITDLESRPIGGGPGVLTYQAEAPLTVDQDDVSVTYGFDLDQLDDVNVINPFIKKRRRPQNTLNNVVNSSAGGFTFSALAPVSVEQQDDTVTYGFMISDLNKI